MERDPIAGREASNGMERDPIAGREARNGMERQPYSCREASKREYVGIWCFTQG